MLWLETRPSMPSFVIGSIVSAKIHPVCSQQYDVWFGFIFSSNGQTIDRMEGQRCLTEQKQSVR